MVASQLLADKKDEINRTFKLFISNTNWINTNLDNLRKQHPNEYIAVYNREVVFTDKDLSDLKEKLRKENVDLQKTAIEFVRKKPIKLLL